MQGDAQRLKGRDRRSQACFLLIWRLGSKKTVAFTIGPAAAVGIGLTRRLNYGPVSGVRFYAIWHSCVSGCIFLGLLLQEGGLGAC